MMAASGMCRTELPVRVDATAVDDKAYTALRYIQHTHAGSNPVSIVEECMVLQLQHSVAAHAAHKRRGT